MKTKFKKLVLLTITVVMFFPVFVFAQSPNPQPTPTTENKDYAVLAPLPGTVGADNKTNLETYLPGAFNLMVGIAAVLAFVMITWGGITYATSDALAEKSQGKEYITNAIYGLLLVIGAWVILNTINPQILNFRLILPRSNIQGTTVTTGTPMTQEQLDADKTVRDELWNSNPNKRISANGNPCTLGQTTGCTNLNGLPRNAIDGLISLNNTCGPLCTVTITGGTEGGHQTHGVGQPMVDLRQDRAIDSFIKDKNRWTTAPRSTSKGWVYSLNVSGKPVEFLDETGGTPHWHVTFH